MESSQANEGLPQLFLSAKLKKVAAGKENCAHFDFVDETKAGTLGSSAFYMPVLTSYARHILDSNSY